MQQTITEQTYPLEWTWVLKSTFPKLYNLVIGLPALIIFTTFANIIAPLAVLFISLIIIPTLLRAVYYSLYRLNFHYSLNDKFLLLRKGIITKEERHIPYTRIQNVIVHQTIADRILGLSNIIIENAAQSVIHVPKYGYLQNFTLIAGLKKENTEKLKELILGKMKTSRDEDEEENSGL